MKQDRTESFESPLDEVLLSMPQEDPPEDLQQRCLDALGGSAAEKPSHPKWWLPVRNVIAVAAGLLLVVGALQFTGMQGRVAEEAMAPPDTVDSIAPPTEDAAADRPAVQMEEGVSAPQSASGVDAGLPATEPEPGATARTEGAEAEMPAPGDAAAPLEGPVVPPPPGDEAREEDFVADPIAPRDDAADIVSEPRRTPAQRPQTPEVEDPWRDFSGERQVITTKQLDMEVGDVEQAYDDTRSIVEKQGGFIATDRVQISEEQADTAHLTIRIPVDNFEAAVAQIRQLGEVTRLVGESVDVTEQYYEEGADIREKADREQWLIDRMENADSERERRRLEQQITQLRRQMKQEKQILGRLAEQTHWPALELTLTEGASPGDFLSRALDGSVSALAWVGATAIIWVPLVVLLTLLWRRMKT
jgi:hypothetical protein